MVSFACGFVVGDLLRANFELERVGSGKTSDGSGSTVLGLETAAQRKMLGEVIF